MEMKQEFGEAAGSAAIGTLDWEACERCRHALPEGGCGIPDSIWETGLYWIPYEEKVGCGQFEPACDEDKRRKE